MRSSTNISHTEVPLIRPNYAIIDLENLGHNIAQVRKNVGGDVKILAVVKANAYGHGLVQISNAALRCGADLLGVAIPEEGKKLRQSGITAPILDFGGLLPENAEMVVDYDITPTVFSESILLALQEKAAQQGKVLPLHIKVDTGMNRIGVKAPADLKHLLQLLKSCENLTLEGLYTHFAISEAADKRFTREQVRRFETMVDLARQMGYAPLLHAANSAAALDVAETRFDLVRMGLALYGYYTGPHCRRDANLLPVLTWKTSVVHVKWIQPGETVSYGRLFTATRPTRVATLPVGYGDGYRRCLSNNACVLIGGMRVPVIGAVCMDQLLCDVTGLPEDVRVGDEAVLMGCQGGECIDAEEMAAWADTITYEILLGINERVPRLYR